MASSSRGLSRGRLSIIVMGKLRRVWRFVAIPAIVFVTFSLSVFSSPVFGSRLGLFSRVLTGAVLASRVGLSRVLASQVWVASLASFVIWLVMLPRASFSFSAPVISARWALFSVMGRDVAAIVMAAFLPALAVDLVY